MTRIHKRWRGKKKLVIKLDRALHVYLADLGFLGESPEEVAIYLIRKGIAGSIPSLALPRNFTKKDAPKTEVAKP